MNDFLDYFFNYIKVAFDQSCQKALSLISVNENLKKLMPVDKLENEIKMVVQFYKLYEKVNEKLMDSIVDSTNINREITDAITNISKEKKKVEELLFNIMKRLKESNLQFQEINSEFTNVITNDLQGFIDKSQEERKNLIK